VLREIQRLTADRSLEREDDDVDGGDGSGHGGPYPGTVAIPSAIRGLRTVPLPHVPSVDAAIRVLTHTLTAQPSTDAQAAPTAGASATASSAPIAGASVGSRPYSTSLQRYRHRLAALLRLLESCLPAASARPLLRPNLTMRRHYAAAVAAAGTANGGGDATRAGAGKSATALESEEVVWPSVRLRRSSNPRYDDRSSGYGSVEADDDDNGEDATAATAAGVGGGSADRGPAAMSATAAINSNRVPAAGTLLLGESPS
jgi:hypothetical protein